LSRGGEVEFRRPKVRVNEATPGEEIKFESKVVPLYLRKTQEISEFVPWLYLKGISSNDFPSYLKTLYGDEAKGLSPSTVMRLKEDWQKEYGQWNQRTLTEEIVYIWADAVYFKVRAEQDKHCFLVVMGSNLQGEKKLLAIEDSFKESRESWLSVLLSLESRGMKAPCVATADGALGFWAALREVYPTTKQQACWVHKTQNVLDALPDSLQKQAIRDLKQMPMASSKADALKSYEKFKRIYSNYPKALNSLDLVKNKLFTFLEFPKEHWVHLRTSNPIESVFATVRNRTDKTRGCSTTAGILTMSFKLVQSAESKWRKLKGFKLLRGVYFKEALCDDQSNPAA